MENKYVESNRFAMFYDNGEEGVDALMQRQAKISPKSDKKKANASRSSKENKTSAKNESSDNVTNSKLGHKDAPKATKRHENENQKASTQPEKVIHEQQRSKVGAKNIKSYESNGKNKDTRDDTNSRAGGQRRENTRPERNWDSTRGGRARTEGKPNGNRVGQRNEENTRKPRFNGNSEYHPSDSEERNNGGNEKRKEMDCFECHEYGHLVRDCPVRAEKNAVRNQERLEDKKCYKCDEAGHIARDCSNKLQNSPPARAIENMECYQCKQKGHRARDCELRIEKQRSNAKTMENSECFKCGRLGHFAGECSGFPSDKDQISGYKKNTNSTENDNQEEDTEEASSIVVNVDDRSEVDTISTIPDLSREGAEIADQIDDSITATGSDQAKEQEKEVPTYTLEEWKAKQGEKNEIQFNIRKPGEGSSMDPKWKKTTAYMKEKEAATKEDEEENPEQYPQRINRQKKLDVQFSFADKNNRNVAISRESRNFRGGKDGRGEKKWGKTESRSTLNNAAPYTLDDASFPSLG